MGSAVFCCSSFEPPPPRDLADFEDCASEVSATTVLPDDEDRGRFPPVLYHSRFPKPPGR